jgi:hypothetical protein
MPGPIFLIRGAVIPVAQRRVTLRLVDPLRLGVEPEQKSVYPTLLRVVLDPSLKL